MVNEPGVSAARTVSAFEDIGITHALVIPDSESRLLFDALVDHPVIDVITPTREGESIAIASGLWTGGAKPIVIIQNTGLMEAGDALRGCAVGPRVPLRLVVGWRGYSGALAGRLPIDSAYTYTEPLLDAWNIPMVHCMSDDDLGAIAEMDATAASTGLPAAVLTGYRFRP